MTIEEAIEKLEWKDDLTKEEYEQLAEYLEELKDYRMSLVCNDMQTYYESGYDKAIDDFSESVKTAVTEMDDIGAYDNPTKRICEILEIEAERLKAGGTI